MCMCVIVESHPEVDRIVRHPHLHLSSLVVDAHHEEEPRGQRLLTHMQHPQPPTRCEACAPRRDARRCLRSLGARGGRRAVRNVGGPQQNVPRASFTTNANPPHSPRDTGELLSRANTMPRLARVLPQGGTQAHGSVGSAAQLFANLRGDQQQPPTQRVKCAFCGRASNEGRHAGPHVRIPALGDAWMNFIPP